MTQRQSELQESTSRLIATWRASLNRAAFGVLAGTALLLTVFVLVLKAR